MTARRAKEPVVARREELSPPKWPAGPRDDAEATKFSAILAPAVTPGLADTVAATLRDSIFHGHLAPGERLGEEALAQALDVSRDPVRSALSQLEREGLVVRRRNRGTFVAHLLRTDLEEIYAVRLAIEPLVSSWAARNGTEDDWARMQAIIDGYAELDVSASPHEAAEADLKFHDAVYRAAAHKRLLRMWQELRPQICIFLLARSYVGQDELAKGMIRNHTLILETLKQRSEPLARRVAEAHIKMSYGKVVNSYDETGAGTTAPKGKRPRRREPAAGSP